MGDNGRFEMLKKEREGMIFKNKWGENAIVIRYGGIYDIDIKYDNGYIQNIKWHNLIKGFHSPYTKTVFGIGYLGEGKYDTNDKLAYSIWSGVLERCYEPYTLNKQPAYRDCTVCEEWHCFQNFAEWFYENYYEIPNERMCLDKDILVKGNKIYSPNTCIFVSNRINVLFIKQQRKRGKYPIGVTEYHNGVRARCNIMDEKGKYKTINLGCFSYDECDKAFLAYKKFKEDYIKQIADEYYFKGLIPKKLYDALYVYKVEIND